METLERTVKIEGETEVYTLDFTVEAVAKAEDKLKSGSILMTLAAPPYSMSDTLALLEGALHYSNKKATIAAYSDIMEKNNLGELQTALIEALKLSGVLGQAKKAKN